MHLPPLSHFPSDAEMSSIALVDAIVAVAAVFCGEAGAGNPQAPLGMSTHLWVARPGMDGVALCGARPLGLYNQWRPVPGQRVDCIRCLSLHAEVLSNQP